MIIFGVQAGVSVTKLFMGGIAPAVYMSLALCVIWFFVAKRDNLPTAPRQTKRQILHSIRDGLWALLLPCSFWLVCAAVSLPLPRQA